MTTSEWVTILSLFCAIGGSTLVLAFKIGVVHEKVISMAKTLDKVVLILEKITSKKKFRRMK